MAYPHAFDPAYAMQVQDVGAEKDAITSLRAPTHFGRPNWDKSFSSLVDKHPDTDVGVVRTHSGPQRHILIPCMLFGSSSADLLCCPSNSTRCVTSTRILAPVELGFSSERVCFCVTIPTLVSNSW